MRITLFAALAVLASSLAVSAPAFGQSTVDGHNPAGPVTLNEVETGGEDHAGRGDPGSASVAQPPAAVAAQGGQGRGQGASLPFTGLDAALLLGAAGLLMVMGLGMRRLTASRAV